MMRSVAAVLIVLFTLSAALTGTCSFDKGPWDIGPGQTLGGWAEGSGHFDDRSQTFVVNGEPLKHLVADLNNDGRPDIAVIYNASSRIDIFYSDTNDRFNYSDRTTIDMPGPVTDIAAGDVDKDLRTDLVVSCNVTGNDVFVLSQANGFNKDAPLHAIASTSKPRALLLKDFNNDTWLDIATLFYADAPPYQPGFEIRLHSEGYDLNMLPVGLGSVGMQRPFHLNAGDLNLDGRIDIVIGDRDAGKVVGYVNGASSGKVWDTATNILSVSNPSALHVAQLGTTGAVDLVVAEQGTSKINIWRYSSGEFTLRTDVVDQASITSMATMDIDGDSRLDLVTTSAYMHNLTVFRASSSLLYGHSSSLAFPVPYHPVHVAVHDMDSDGSEDLVVSSRSSSGHGAVTIYYRNGQDISNADRNRIVKDISPTLMTLGDFDRDGSNEIAAYDPSGPSISFISGTSSLGRLIAPSEVVAIDCRDLDGDGYDDIAMMTADSVTVWFGSSSIFSGVSGMVTVESTITGLSSLFLGDLNDDGRPDIAVGGSGGVDMFWNAGTGDGYSEAQRFTLSLPGGSITSLATVTVRGMVHNDSLADLVLLNSTVSRLEIYYQQQSAGNPYTTASCSYLNTIPGMRQLRTGDLNSDGLEDLSVLSSNKVHIYFQTPSYSYGFSDSQPIAVIDVPEGPRSLILGDLDDDGMLDLAVVSTNSTLMAYGHDGSSFSLLTRQTTGAAPVLLAVGDMNGDGKDDLVAYSAPSRSISFYYQNNFPPMAQANLEGSGHLEGDLVWFNAYGSTDSFSDRDRLTYRWDFDDGSMADGERVSHVFLANGPYNVTLRVSDPWGGWDEKMLQVSIGDRPPTADFTFQSAPAPIEGSPVTFTDLSNTPVDAIVRWEWNFGDGTLTNRTDGQPVHHIFRWNGTFTVTLTVVDSDGSTDTISRQVLVLDSAPVADFSTTVASPLEGQEIGFIDRSAYTADPIVIWRWDFGDGTLINVTSNATQNHVYNYSGTYIVTLTVEDIDGSVHSMNREIVVLDSPPTAGFEPSSLDPEEGQRITFADTSTYALNPIVRWSWDMGDGTWYNFSAAQSVAHTYTNNGTYVVTLAVEDVDGDVHSISRTITVRDTSPVISKLYIVGGASSFKEWDEVVLEVMATERWDPIARYEWSFETVVFQIAEETQYNTTSYRYNSSGTYRIFVRVWDSDSYSEASVQITITDPAPIPDFTASTNPDDRTVRFSAARTRDTENDQEWLRYRWFFGDGQQTEWSYSYLVEHTYQKDGVYSVRLEVRDDRNPPVSKTGNVTVDLLPPDISMDEPVLKAVVGRPTLIKVSVTDLVGVGSVRLEYTIDNVTRTVVMTHEGNGTYFAQIPAQNRTMVLTYRIIAEDMAGHVSMTDRFTLVLEFEDPSLFILSSSILLAAFLAIIIYLFLSRPIVDEVFVMYHDGTLLAHQTRRLKPGMDDDILAGMLIALQNFVRDSFKDERSTVLRRMDFGDRKLLVERKDDFFMAAVLSGKRAGNAAQRMAKVLENIDRRYADVLKDWDGDLEKVRGIRDETKLMFRRANPLDWVRRERTGEDSL